MRLLHHAAIAQHGDAVGHVRDHGEVVGDEEQGGAVVAVQLAQQVEHLALAHHVERGRRLVGDHEVGAEHGGDGDHHALALPARELVRVAPGELGADADAGEVCARRLAGLGGGQGAVQQHRLGHLPVGRLHGVERGHGLLEDHADARAPHGAQLALGRVQQLPAVEAHRARGARVGRQQAGDRQGGERLARARLAHQPVRLAPADGERHAV